MRNYLQGPLLLLARDADVPHLYRSMSVEQLPIELVRDIIDVSLAGALHDNRRWIAQDLALVSRAIYDAVVPALFETWYIPAEKIHSWHEHVTTSPTAAQNAQLARVLIVDAASSPYAARAATDAVSAVRWDVPAFQASFSLVRIALVPLKVLSALCSAPLFRPQHLFLPDYDIDALVCDLSGVGVPAYPLHSSAHASGFPAFSQLSHIFVQEIDSLFLVFTSSQVLALPLPSLTHLKVARFDRGAGDAVQRLRALLTLLPRLERILLGLVRPQPDITILLQFAALRDPRIFYSDSSSERIGRSLDMFAFTVRSARMDRDGEDIWNTGTSVLKFVLAFRYGGCQALTRAYSA